MFIHAEKDQILMPLENGTESLIFPDCSNYSSGISSILELPKSSPLPTICTDVNVDTESKRNELERLISNLEDEIDGLRLKQKSLDGKRREVLNKILDLKGSIRVYSRIRPFLPTDRKQIHEQIVAGPEKIVVRSAGSRKDFEFDKVFSQASTQEDVFVEVEPILKSALDGHNVCILAYGQTGTGKTFTMEGTNDQAGIVPRAMKELFRRASLDKLTPITFSMSMLEVYMGSLRDLLAPKPSRRAYEPVARCNLNIQTDPKGMVEIEGLTEVSITDFSKASWWYSKGRRVRSTSCTRVNDMSSRSHCLTRITMTQHGDASNCEPRVSKLWMVDLGGSERLLKTGATGLTLDEGRAINLSLSALGDVIAALRKKRGHVPYRNSKLTQILKDSLGYGSKVLMLVHASPCEEDVAETICSLSFAKRARAVESNQELPEDIKKQKQKKIEELSNTMREAEEEHEIVIKQLHKAKFLLSENKKLFSSTHQNVEEEDHEKTRTSVKDEFREETPQTPNKTTKRNSLPRFMTSTMASRQRQNASEKDIDLRTRILRSGTRSSVQLSGSQSIISLDPRLKAMLRNSGTKPPRDGGTKAVLTGSPRCNNGDLSCSVIPRNKMVTSSNPSFKAPLSRHRRRMSDFH